MGNPLLAFWTRLFDTDDDERRARRASVRVAAASAAQASATIFLILRRMRAPLIVLIVIFAVSVLGLTVIPGEDAEGRPYRMGFFDAFYVMSYTATTIGFGEIPYPFTYNQRMWVTISIYLTVIGWAYAIGSLLALLQDRAFRSALALQRFTRKVARLGEPFVLVAGLRADRGAARALDGRAGPAVRRPRHGPPERIDGLELESYHADVPGLAADVRDPGHLGVAGLDHAVLRGGRRAHRRRRGQPRRRDGGGAAAPRRPGDRARHVPGDGRADAGLRLRRAWSTRSTASATTCGWPCARRPPTSC